MKPAVCFKKVNGKVKLFFRKDFLEGKIGLKPIYKSDSGHDFAYFKKWALTSLKNQYDKLKEEAKGIKQSEEVTKGFRFVELELKKAFPVGTIRIWKGKKFIKSPDKKWRPYYDETTTGKENSKENLGRRRAILAIARKISSLEDGDYKGLYDIIQANKDRFFSSNSDRTKMIELYEAMREKGAVGSGRFSKKKAEKKEEPKVEVKPEKVEEKPKEEEKEKESEEEEKVETKENEVEENTEKEKEKPKEEEKKENEIPESFEEMTVYLKKDGTTFKIEERVGNMYNGRWLDGEKEGYSGYLSEGALKNKDLTEILSIKEKAPETEEQKEALSMGVLATHFGFGASGSLAFDKTQIRFYTGRISTSVVEGNGFKALVEQNIDCDNKTLLARMKLAVDVMKDGKVINEKLVKHDGAAPGFEKQLEKNGVILTVDYNNNGVGTVMSADFETNSKEVEKNVNDFISKIDEDSTFEYNTGIKTSPKNDKAKWSDALKRVGITKRSVKSEITRNDNWVDNRKKMREAKDEKKAAERTMSREPTMENIKACAKIYKAKYIPVETMDKTQSEEEIIKSIAGHDEKGHCVSLALTYIARKRGLDVFDFRGGGSRKFFCEDDKQTAIFKCLGVKTMSIGECGSYSSDDMFSRLEEGKEYFLCVGRHASIIRKNKEGNIQYLELQAKREREIGWHDFKGTYAKGTPREKEYDFYDTLHNRFKVQTTWKDMAFGYVFDINEIGSKNIDDFKEIIGYLNTKENKQKKEPYIEEDE